MGRSKGRPPGRHCSVIRGQRDIGKVLRAARRHGVEIASTGKSHIRLYCPNGATITCSASPSDTHAWKNVVRDLRRYGNIDLTVGG